MRSTILDVIALLFLARVLGQLGVYLGAAPFLPPMREWQSGLMPYPILLASQVLILGIMFYLRFNFPELRRKLRTHVSAVSQGIRIFAALYLLLMVVRFFIYIAGRMRGEYFMGGWIPIVFHWLLAGYLFTVAAVLSKPEER